MKTPMRWNYPQCYRLLQAMVNEHGIHSYEFSVVVDVEPFMTPVMTVQYGEQTWSESVAEEALINPGFGLSTALGTIVREMATAREKAYHDFMQHREV